MFANFLYFLVALIIYATLKATTDSSSAHDAVQMSHAQTAAALLYTALTTLGFTIVCKLVFRRLQAKAHVLDDAALDLGLQKQIKRMSLLAIFLFSSDLYLFRLTLLFSGTEFLVRFPTFEALIFLAFFILHLVIVWAFAWEVQDRIMPHTLSRRDYIRSNLSISLPAILPWFIISILADLIPFLPFEAVRVFLLSPQGEILFILGLLTPIAILAPVMIARFWRCKPLSDSPERSIIENVCQKAGLKYKSILQWDLFGGGMITAGVMGLIARFRYILVTPAMVRVLNPKEIEAVILHEIGHVQKRHMLFYLLFFIGFMLVIYFLTDPMILLLYLAWPIFQAAAFIGISKAEFAPVLFSGILILMFILYFRYLFGFFMRNFERQADIHVFSFMDNAIPLITTFHKIAAFSRQSPDKPSWHHFSISERVAFLKRCHFNPRLIDTHHKKIRCFLGIYVMVMILACFCGYAISYGWAKDGFEGFVTQQLIKHELKINPENSDLYVLVGDYYYGLKKHKKAIEAYENVLRIDPENVHALNNLSWLLSTCPDTELIDPSRALDLAQRAVKIEPLPHILDTHAQACFLNRDFQCAMDMAMAALEKATDKQSYYRDQLDRFKRAYDATLN